MGKMATASDAADHVSDSTVNERTIAVRSTIDLQISASRPGGRDVSRYIIGEIIGN
jgi:hypothetical protein